MHKLSNIKALNRLQNSRCTWQHVPFILYGNFTWLHVIRVLFTL